LRKLRNYADYDEYANITKNDAEKALLSAKEVLVIIRIKDR